MEDNMEEFLKNTHSGKDAFVTLWDELIAGVSKSLAFGDNPIEIQDHLKNRLKGIKKQFKVEGDENGEAARIMELLQKI